MKKTLLSSYLIIFLIAITSGVRAQYITTIAGTGTPAFGGDGGAAISAQLHGNYGMALDRTGNIYIADTGNHRIRKIDIGTGIITTVAGTGTSGFSGDGGAATAARLNTPTGLAVDGTGNIYIADQLNHRIRMVDSSTGIISTVAGTGTAGYNGDGIAANTAQLSRPYGVALDGGDLYIADRSNNRVRQVSFSTGLISTVAGNGTVGFSGDGSSALSANLNRPIFIAFDGSHNMYIVDNGNNRIRSVDGSGIINTEAGNGSTGYAAGAATASGLNGPTGIAFDASNNFYIADAGNHSIRMVANATGMISTVVNTAGTAGFSGDCGTPAAAELNVPNSVLVDGAGRLDISDGGNNRIRKILLPCSGAPASGTASATATTGCPFYATTLSVTGASFGCDITYQWQSSTDGISFFDISGATNATYTPSLSSSVYIQRVDECVATGSPTASSAVYLNVNPLPVISPISGPTQVCIGATITLTDTATSGTWTASNGSGTISSTGDVTGVSAGIDTIRYSSTNACGTTTTSHIVTVYPVVTPSVTFTANPGFSVCNGNSVTYTATGTNGGATPLYQWYVNGTYAGLGAFFTYTPANGDVIMVKLTTSAPCATVATATAAVTMVVTSLLTPGVTVANGTLGDTVCAGTSVNYYVNVVNGGGSPTYQWYLNGTPTVTTSTYTYSPSGGDIIACRVTSSFTCASPATAYDSMVMVVDATETPDINITANPGDTSCTGYAVTYTAHARYRGDSPLYVWIKNGVNVATGTTFTYTPTNGDSVQCLFLSNAICRTVDSVYSNMIHMVINAPTTSSAVISAHPDTTILAGTSDTLRVSAINTGTGSTFQWYLNGVAVTGATTSTFVSSTFADHDSVYCVVYGTNPCSTPAIVTSNGLVIHVITISGVHNVAPSISAINLVPNPNAGSFSVDATITGDEHTATIMVTDLVGRTIYSNDAAITNGKIRHQVTIGSDIANGLYMVQVVTNSGRQVVRFNLDR